MGSLAERVFSYQDAHPYHISFVVAVGIMLVLLFTSTAIEITDDIPEREDLQFIDISMVQERRKVFRREVTTEASENSDVDAERAGGTATGVGAPVDLAFQPGIARPQLIGKMRTRMPKMAKESGVEADVFAEMIIDAHGKVHRVKIVGIKLNKDLPPALAKEIKRLFRIEARRGLMRARFTPPIIKGRRHAIRMDQRVKYRLTN